MNFLFNSVNDKGAKKIKMFSNQMAFGPLKPKNMEFGGVLKIDDIFFLTTTQLRRAEKVMAIGKNSAPE